MYCGSRPLGVLVIDPCLFRRFTVYDFKQMKRRSNYPFTQTVSTMTATSSTGVGFSRPATPLTPSGENRRRRTTSRWKRRSCPHRTETMRVYDRFRPDLWMVGVVQFPFSEPY